MRKMKAKEMDRAFMTAAVLLLFIGVMLSILAIWMAPTPQVWIRPVVSAIGACASAAALSMRSTEEHLKIVRVFSAAIFVVGFAMTFIGFGLPRPLSLLIVPACLLLWIGTVFLVFIPIRQQQEKQEMAYIRACLRKRARELKARGL